MTKDKDNLILKEFILEVLGAFNLAKFKAISATNERPPLTKKKKKWDEYGNLVDDSQRFDGLDDVPGETHPEIAYAQKSLRELGAGSARVAFAISSDKVLKVARNSAGIGQNMAEVEMYQKNASLNLLTKIFDYDKKDHKWIIAEIVKPFENPRDIQTILGTTGYRFEFWLEKLLKGGTLRDIRQNIQDNIVQDEYAVMRYPDVPQYKTKVEEGYAQLANKKMWDFFAKLIEFQENNPNIVPGDLRVIHHYGRTIAGEIRLLDYGFTREVANTLYEEEGS